MRQLVGVWVQPARPIWDGKLRFISVDLPAPLSPTMPSTSPRWSLKLTESSAVIAPKYFDIPFASRSGAPG
jgi:hypothetical protein